MYEYNWIQGMLYTVRLSWPVRSQQNAQCIWSSPLTETGIAVCVWVILIARRPSQPFNVTATNAPLLLYMLFLTSPQTQAKVQVQQDGLCMLLNRMTRWRLLVPCVDVIQYGNHGNSPQTNKRDERRAWTQLSIARATDGEVLYFGGKLEIIK
jgi:hypothetical protein